jgi:pimeloyl-ACP methyl ester carboxylesterase
MGGSTPSAEPVGAVIAEDVLVGRKRLRYVDVGHGRPVLFIHGTGGSWEVWRANIAELARRHRVIAVDLPGFGESETIGPTPDMAVYAEFLSGLLEQLKCGPATVVGHSLGGIVCLHLALDHPAQVQSLVLVDSGGAPISDLRKRVVVHGLRIAQFVMGRRLAMKVILGVPRIRAFAFGFVVKSPGSVDQALLDGAFLTMRAPGVGVAISAGVRDTVGDRLHQVHTPTLLIWGDSDRILPVRLAHQMEGAMPDARLVIIPDSGHCPNIEHSARFNALIDEWTDTVTATK